MPFSYLIWDAIFGVTPCVILWLKFKPLLRKYRKTAIAVVVCSLVFGIGWDILFQGRVWDTKTNSLGLNFLTVPVEDYIFTISLSLLACWTTLILKYQRRKV